MDKSADRQIVISDPFRETQRDGERQRERERERLYASDQHALLVDCRQG